jgi:MYXO-CTERM domain-containing protein
MPSSSDDQPKYLACARALALLTGLAASVTVCESTASGAGVPDGGPASVAAEAQASAAPASAYDGGPHGVVIMPSGGCGCDLGGAPVSPSVPLVSGLAGAGLIARRRRRSDRP